MFLGDISHDDMSPSFSLSLTLFLFFSVLTSLYLYFPFILVLFIVIFIVLHTPAAPFSFWLSLSLHHFPSSPVSSLSHAQNDTQTTTIAPPTSIYAPPTTIATADVTMKLADVLEHAACCLHCSAVPVSIYGPRPRPCTDVLVVDARLCHF